MSKNNEKYKTSKGIKILTLLCILSSLFAIYEIFLLSGIENLIRYAVIGVLILLDILIIIKSHKKKHGLFIVLSIIYMILCLTIAGAIYYVYGKINGFNKVFTTYTSDLIVMSNSGIDKVDDIHDKDIGILSDKSSPEGYIIPEDVIRKNKLDDDNNIKKYDDYTSMIVDLYDGKLGAMFVSSHYVSMFSSNTGYENIASDTKVVLSESRKLRKSSNSTVETASLGKSVNEPFTILLMGIDSTDEVLEENAIANGDTLILITFNPKTLNATMFSIPRDSYVPIACWSGKPENKITHAAAYGNDCMINTIQDYFDVNIDYYAKINFKGLVKLVDAVGGVEVDVPKRLCTDDSSRGGEVCINPGHQTLNGEEALVFARDRKQLANGDFGRAEHQQELIMALMNKIKTIKNISQFTDILNTVSNSMDTNLSTKQILSFYNVAKDIVRNSSVSSSTDILDVQKLFLQGTGQMIYDERARMVLWDYVPNKSSRRDIINAMKVNLGLEDHDVIKEFSFSINEPYEEKVIGEGPYKSTSTYTLLPSFVGDSEAQARAAASRLGVSVVFRGNGGYVVSQNYPANKRVDLIKGSVTLTLSGSTTKKDVEDDEKEVKKNITKKDDSKEDDGTGTKEDNDNKDGAPEKIESSVDKRVETGDTPSE